MIIDGSKISRDILTDIKETLIKEKRTPTLAIITCGEDFATQQYITLKKKKAREVGIDVLLKTFPKMVNEETLVQEVKKLSENVAIGGIIIQLPLPKHITAGTILDAVILQKDIDVLSHKSQEKFSKDSLDILPPVIGAISTILEKENIQIRDKKVVVVGRGFLVGRPAVVWFKNKGAHVKVTDRYTQEFQNLAREADIIVLGAGSPVILKPDMISKGVILFDAGTSELKGRTTGDVDEKCVKKAKIFTPVPGGIGPITVAILLQNLVQRSKLTQV